MSDRTFRVIAKRLSERTVCIIFDITQNLIGGKSADHAFAVSDGDQIRLGDQRRICIIPSRNAELRFAQAQAFCQNFRIEHVFSDRKIEGI